MSKQETEEYVDGIIKDCNAANRKLDRIETICSKLILSPFGQRKSLKQAYDYTTMLAERAGKDGIPLFTAVGVMVNTIRLELEKAMQEDSVDD